MSRDAQKIRREPERNNKWKWVLGLTVATVVVLVPAFAWRIFLPYGMMGIRNEWYMPMMNRGPEMMPLGMMFLMWLILLASLVLIGLGIVWLVKGLSAQIKS